VAKRTKSGLKANRQNIKHREHNRAMVISEIIAGEPIRQLV
jgi:hypothetical protein